MDGHRLMIMLRETSLYHGGQYQPKIAGLRISGVQHRVVAVLSDCSRELPALRRGTDQVPFAASDVEEHGDAAVGFRARCREELHARGWR